MKLFDKFRFHLPLGKLHHFALGAWIPWIFGLRVGFVLKSFRIPLWERGFHGFEFLVATFDSEVCFGSVDFCDRHFLACGFASKSFMIFTLQRGFRGFLYFLLPSGLEKLHDFDFTAWISWFRVSGSQFRLRALLWERGS